MPRILVVEDDLLNQEVVSAILELDGYQILFAGTPERGLELAASEHPDLILMDMQLPGMTGYEVPRRLKSDPATRPIPVIAFTAQAMRGDESRARGAGCDGHLSKPVDAPVLRETVRRFLSARGEARAAEA